MKIKVDRVIKLAKAARTEMVQLSTGDLELEEQVNHESNQFQIIIRKLHFQLINFFGLRDNLTEYLELLKECDSDESKEGKV